MSSALTTPSTPPRQDGSRCRPRSTSTPPFLWRLRSSKGLITTTVAWAAFVDCFLYGIVVPVLPFTLSSRIGIPEDDVQYWNSALLGIYGAALALGAPPFGWIGDRISSRRLSMILALFILLGSTVLFMLSQSIALLIVARVLQGFSAAAVWSVGLALLVDTVGPGDGIGQALGIIAITNPLGAVISPVVGGALFATSGYYAVWIFLLALIVVDIVLRFVMLEKKDVVRWQRESNITELPQILEGDRAVLANDQIANTEPLLPSATESLGQNTRHLPEVILLLGSPRLLAALWATLVEQGMQAALDATLPLHVSQVFDWDSTKAGLIFLALLGPYIVLDPLIGRLSDKIGTRIPSVAGLLLGAPCLILLRFVEADSTVALLVVLLILLGVSGAGVVPATLAEMSHVVESRIKRRPLEALQKDSYAQAFGLYMCAQGCGLVLFSIMSGVLVDRFGWEVMTGVLGGFYLSAAILVCLYTGDGWVKRPSHVEVVRG